VYLHLVTSNINRIITMFSKYRVVSADNKRNNTVNVSIKPKTKRTTGEKSATKYVSKAKIKKLVTTGGRAQ